jgi:hypothetical protein
LTALSDALSFGISWRDEYEMLSFCLSLRTILRLHNQSNLVMYERIIYLSQIDCNDKEDFCYLSKTLKGLSFAHVCVLLELIIKLPLQLIFVPFVVGPRSIFSPSQARFGVSLELSYPR